MSGNIFKRLLPKSLLGQMLLSVALALLVAQTISAVLLYREAERRREMVALNGLAFQLAAEPRFDYRQTLRTPGNERRVHWQRLRVQRTGENPMLPDENRDAGREQAIRTILAEQGIDPEHLVVTSRTVADDKYIVDQAREEFAGGRRPLWADGQILVAGMQRQGDPQWTVARITLAGGDPRQLSQMIGQTLLLYAVLVGGLAILLRRITRPLAALRKRVETFARSLNTEGQVEPSGPEDARLLISAHNAMEDRIAALLDEKNVMLGAIGHDLKTPLAALRVRIESVEDDAERAKLAAGIDDIARSLDDILSLARVGRPSDPLERTDLGALVASIVEEYEDMGEPVAMGPTARLPMPLRATWLRRGMRNLISNALRYGETATVSLLRDNGEAVVRIEDEGPGIPENEIGAMLEPFARGEASRNRETGGAGLGLTLARAIAEQHGGRLVLANRPSQDGRKGLIAELRLPIA